LDKGEEKELDESEEGEDAEGTEARLAEGVVEGDGVEEEERRGGEKKDAEIEPPGGEVAFDLGGGAGEDVEAEVLVDEKLAEAVEHVEVPGKDEGEKEQQAEEEVGAEAAEERGLEREEENGGEEEGDAGGAFGHERDGETDPEEIPGEVEDLVQVEFGEADEGEGDAEGEEDVHFSDACDVEEAGGGEEDEGGEPGGEAGVTKGEPEVEQAAEGDAGERGAEASGELEYAEELEEEGGDPEHEGRLFEPGLEVPMGDEEAVAEHFAGDLGVDAFVPVGEAVVAEEGEEDYGGEKDSKGAGEGCLAERAGAGEFGGLRFRGHGDDDTRCGEDRLGRDEADR
jgi:hypothetical protein